MLSKTGNCRHCRQPIVGKAGTANPEHTVCHRCHIKLLSHGYKKEKYSDNN